MSGSARIRVQTSVAGISLESTIVRNEELEQAVQVELAAGIAGVLSTRTDNDAGVLTVGSGHGVTTDDSIAIFWADGSMYSGNVTATTATTITFDSGLGDDLPDAASAVVIGVEQSHSFSIVGDNLVVLAIQCPNRSIVQFFDSTTLDLVYDMEADEGRLWISDQGVTNPLATDNTDSVKVANGETTATTLKIGTLATTN